MGRKTVETNHVISVKEMEKYRFHIDVLIDIINSEDVDKIVKLDHCLNYLTDRHLNDRDIRNMIFVNSERAFGNNGEENILVAISALLNIYHLMHVFKTSVE